MNKLLAVLASMIILISLGIAQSTPPRIYYSDLASGPNVGGKNNAGAFVTVYGSGFGSAQGNSMVTIGGVKAASYPIWSQTKVTFQLGQSARSGNVVINVSGVASNSVPFTVAPGRIYFVSASGSATNPGSYNAPWSSLRMAKNKMAPGDIVYVEDGTAVTNIESNSTSLVLNNGGTATAPKAIIAYPGSTVTVGSSTGANTGIQVASKYWVLSGLTIRGAVSSIVLSDATGARLSSNDISCPNGSGSAACVRANASSSLAFFGNYVHDSGLASSTNVGSYHSIAFTGSDAVEVGWNQIANTRGCNALMLESGTGVIRTLSVHDNYIHDTRCAAVSINTAAAAPGEVNLYNNVISNAGVGPDPEAKQSGSAYAAIVVGGGSFNAVHAFNNTIYHAGAIGGGEAGAVHATGAVELTNNIIYLEGGEQYVSLDTDLSWVSGSNNLFHGSGNPVGVFSNSVVADPELASPGSGNFHLLASSPAISAGTSTTVSTDFDGVTVPQSGALSIGAYDYSSRHSWRGRLSSSPASIAFGTLSVGQSGTATAVISNSGSSTVKISQAVSNNSQFTVVSFPATLSPGQSGTLTGTFAPSASGAQSGTVSVTSNADNPTLNIGVSGSGSAAAPVASLSASSLTFVSQIVNTTSTSQVVTLTNSGNASLTISSIAASGDFASTNTCGAMLAAGSSCSISVTFTPTATVSRTGALTVTDNASSKTQTVALSGTGAAVPTATLQASSTALSFGSVTMPGSGTQSITITNTGTASATISSISSTNAVFTASGLTTVAAGGSTTLTVVFTPAAASTYSGTITVQSNATNATLSIAASGTGLPVPAPVASLSASSLTFVSQIVNTTSTSQVVTLTNSGNASLTISSIAASGDFASTNTCGAMLAAGSSCSISVTFTPTATGSRTGALTVTDNASSKTQTVALSGTGAAVPTATLQASSTALSFGSVTMPGSGTQSITITNTGTASATISSISSTNAVFTASGLTTVAAGGSTTLTVVFTPAAANTYTGTITVQSNATNATLSIAASGTGLPVPAPVASLSTTSLTFASQIVNTTSTSQAVTLSNTGNASLTISSIAASGDFASSNTCGATLAAGASCSISVTFTPTATGSRTGALTVTDNASSKTQTVALSGIGAAVPTATLQASSTALSFGSVTMPGSGTQSITITNTGTASATISSISSTNAVFAASGLTTIAAGASATLTVVFTPVAASTYSGTITVQSNATNATLSIAASGTGLPVPAPVAGLSASSVLFASQIVNTTSTAQALTLTNSGNASLTISSIAPSGDFASTNTCGATLAAGASCSISVTFTPTATGSRTGALTVTDNASSKTQTVALSGIGAAVPTATLQASSTSLSFGSVTMPGSGTQSITITNTGTASATISSISSTNAVFAASGPTTIAAGGSTTLTVVFTPAAASTYSGTITVQSNATNATLSIAASGTGAAAAVQHSVSLSWSEASSSAVGYNVYRSTQSGTAYAKLTASAISTTAYTDNSVSAGATYYYVLTAVDASGNESAYSAQVSATVPTP